MVLHPHKYTVLHKLAQYGRSRVFDFLTIAKRFGANINLQDAKGKTVLHYASCNYNHGNALPFVRHGARYDIADENGLVPIQCVIDSFKSNYVEVEESYGRFARTDSSRFAEKIQVSDNLTNFFRLLAMGATYKEHGKTLAPLKHLEYSLVNFGTSYQICMLIIDIGYRFSFLDDLILYDSNLKSVIYEVQQAMPQPLTLEKQAANFLRTRLQPNAFVGAQRLGLPPGFNKSIITLGVCGEEACTECAQRTCRYVPSTCSKNFLENLIVTRDLNNK